MVTPTIQLLFAYRNKSRWGRGGGAGWMWGPGREGLGGINGINVYLHVGWSLDCENTFVNVFFIAC